MKRVHIIGGKNHGKTTLVCDLVAEFRARGLQVGTIKHTHHHHELDTPGKDSHGHREAGAEAVGILSRSMSAVFWPHHSSNDSEDRYRSFEPIMAGCDLVLVEGDTQTRAPKLEVWRASAETDPLSKTLPGVRAIVTDDPVEDIGPVLSRADVPKIADLLLSVLQNEFAPD